jgi:Secretion system C-terminal sorting domain
MKNIYFWLLLSLLAIPFRLWSQCIDTDDAAQNHSGTIKTLLGSTIDSFDWRQVQIFAYPNPATDYITVGCVNNQLKEVHFSLSEVNGGKIYENQLPDVIGNESIRKVFKIAHLAAGTYIVTMNVDKQTFSTKIIKQ